MRKVCIVGCSDSKNLAPFQDESYEFWGVNNLFLSLPNVKWSRWYEIHNIDFDGVNWKRRNELMFRGQLVNDYIKSLASLPCPVYMQQKWGEIQNSVIYPINEIVNTCGTNYITNTIAHQTAHAIYEHLIAKEEKDKIERLDIFGVDMAVHTEYGHQRPSCEYWIGIAVGLGIKIHIPPEADLLKTRFIYGVQEKEQDSFMKKMKHLKLSMMQRKAESDQKTQIERDKTNQYIGAISAINEITKIWD